MNNPYHPAPPFQQVMPQQQMGDPRMIANAASGGFQQGYGPDPSNAQLQPGQPMNIAPQQGLQAKLAQLLMQVGGGQQDPQAMPAATGDLY